MIKNFLDKFKHPYYSSSNCIIFNCDCLTMLDKLPLSSINLTFTSPPYNIGKSYEVVKPVQEYIDWCETWVNKLYQITSDDGSFLLNVGYLSVQEIARAIPISYLLWDKIPFYLQQEIIWNYSAGVACKNYLSPRHETILWYVKNNKNYCFNLDSIRDKDVKYPNQKKNGKLRCNSIGKNPSDVWQIAKVTSGTNRSSTERVNHPAQTPLDVCDRVIKGFSNEGDLVLDPFMGSGSTMISAIKNNRFFIGFEINKDYCDLAVSRLENFMRR